MQDTSTVEPPGTCIYPSTYPCSVSFYLRTYTYKNVKASLCVFAIHVLLKEIARWKWQLCLFSLCMARTHIQYALWAQLRIADCGRQSKASVSNRVSLTSVDWHRKRARECQSEKCVATSLRQRTSEKEEAARKRCSKPYGWNRYRYRRNQTGKCSSAQLHSRIRCTLITYTSWRFFVLLVYSQETCARFEPLDELGKQSPGWPMTNSVTTQKPDTYISCT